MSTFQPQFVDSPAANRPRTPVVLGSGRWLGRLFGFLVLVAGFNLGYQAIYDRSLSVWVESPWYVVLPVVAVLLAVFITGYYAMLCRHSLTIDPNRSQWMLRTGVFPFFRRFDGRMEEIGGVVLRRDVIRTRSATKPIFAIDIEWRQPDTEPFRVQEFEVEVWHSGSFQLRSRGESCLPAARARAMEIARLTGLPLHDEIAIEEVIPAQLPDIECTEPLDNTVSDGETAGEMRSGSLVDGTGFAPEAQIDVSGTSVLRLLCMWFRGYAISTMATMVVAGPFIGPSYLKPDRPPINWDAVVRVAAVVFTIATVVLIVRHVPMAASTLIRIRNGQFHGHRRWLLVNFRRIEYPLDFVRRVRVDGSRIEVEFAPPPETSIYPSVRPVPKLWYFAHGLPVDELYATVDKLRSTVAAVLAAHHKRDSEDGE